MIKTILYMGITSNGMIAKENGDSEWTSQEDLQGFFEQSKKAGNIILGRNTFEAAKRYGYFPFPEAVNVVVTHGELKNEWGDAVIITDDEPREILADLEKRGFTTAFLAGGGKLNASFFSQGLVDEIYLDVEPLLFGRGIPVIAPCDFFCELSLLEVKKLNSDTVQLHYQVKK